MLCICVTVGWKTLGNTAYIVLVVILVSLSVAFTFLEAVFCIYFLHFTDFLFITLFVILLMHWGFFVCLLNCWQRAFFFPPKKIFAKQSKMDCPVIPGAHKSFRSSGCLPILVMNPATVAKTVNHIRINCKTGPVIIFSFTLPRNKSKK